MNPVTNGDDINFEEDVYEVCLQKFEWFLIKKQSGINARIDGVLGLSRSKMAELEEDDSSRGVGPLIVNHLADENVIEHNLFAFYMVSEDDP